MARKYKPITITGSSGGAQTDYQVEVELTYDADMQADFSDVRFRDTDQVTLLDFWLETYTASTTATFWVKVPSIPANPDTVVIYAYYGNASAPGGSDGVATFLDFDDFNRANLNNATTWAKSAENPLTATGYGDPGIYYESGTYYLFVDDLASGDIRLFTDTDPEFQTISDEGIVLARGAATAWDDFQIRDPSVIKVGSTYHMWYGGQVDSGGGATTHQIGHATSSSLTSGWSKDGSNPIMSVAGADGCNEPSVKYDAAASSGEEFQMFYTYGSGGNKDDVGTGDIGLAYSSDGSSWSDQGTAIAAGAISYQDQEQIQDDDGIWHMFLNPSATVGGNDIIQSQSLDMENWGTPIGAGGIPHGTTPSYDDAIYAPTLVKIGSTYYLYYQAQNDSVQYTIALATASSIASDTFFGPTAVSLPTVSPTDYVISGNRFYKGTGGADQWHRMERPFPKSPPYVMQTDIEFEAEDSAGYCYGIIVAEDASKQYHVIFDPSANQIGLWDESTVLSNTTSYTVDLATAHKLRAIVTASNIQIDWFDGTTWQTNVLSQAITSTPAAMGYLGYEESGTNEFYADNLFIRKYVSPEPSAVVGAEFDDESSLYVPRHGAVMLSGVAIV